MEHSISGKSCSRKTKSASSVGCRGDPDAISSRMRTCPTARSKSGCEPEMSSSPFASALSSPFGVDMLLRSLTAGTALVPRNRPYRRLIQRSVMFQPREPAVNGRRRACRGACTTRDNSKVGTYLTRDGRERARSVRADATPGPRRRDSQPAEESRIGVCLDERRREFVRVAGGATLRAAHTRPR
jgi:hypothetical protein